MLKGSFIMTKQQFFSDIMTICDWDRLGNDEAVLEPLVLELSQRSDEEIFSFDDIMADARFTVKTFDRRKRIQLYNVSVPNLIFRKQDDMLRLCAGVFLMMVVRCIQLATDDIFDTIFLYRSKS